MGSEPTEPLTLRSIHSVAGAPNSSSGGTTASQRHSYRCHNCNYTIHIDSTTPSFFPCPCCHRYHLIPAHTISLPLSPPDYTAPASSNYVYLSSDEDYDSDNSLPSLTTSGVYPLTPASESVAGSLPVKVFSPNSTLPLQSCSICMEDFVVDSGSSGTVNELPCGHYFHKDCIVEWLQKSNTCPLCRYKLPFVRKQKERFEPAVNYWNVNTETNTAASGSEIASGETTNRNSDPMRDEDRDTIIDA